MEATGQIARKTRTRRVKGEYIVANLADAAKFIPKVLILKLINVLIRVRSRIVAPGKVATGVSLVRMNLLDITENTRELNRSNVFTATGAFHDQII